MTLKTYRARTMGDALAEVKKDLGRSAVILHTRTFKVGGWLGFGGKAMVEITASDGVNVAPPKTKKPESDPGSRAAASAVSRAYSAPAPRPAVLEEPPEAKPDRGPVLTPVHAAMDQELAAIRRMVGQVLQCSRQTAMKVGHDGAVPGIAMPDALTRHYLRLMEQDVAAEIADEVVASVRDELTPAELGDESIVRETMLRHLAGMIPTEDQPIKPGLARDGRPLTIALVGPTGVGKTTTVAKLAAAYKLRHGKRVGLVTTDTYRIAAVDQLRTYAEIIGLPLKVAMSPAEIGTVCQSLSDCDVVLIDTAGRSQRDSGRLDELAQFIGVAKPHQVHLVLSSTGSEAVLIEAAQRFARVRPDRVIFTKLDESVNFGVLVTVARKVALKLSFVTTGQEVPDHIEVGRADRIARLLLEGNQPR